MGTPGVTLLDRTSDPDHDRSVVTFAGPRGRRPGGGQARGDRRRSHASTCAPSTVAILVSAPWTWCRSCPSATRPWTSASSLPATFGCLACGPVRPAGVPVRARGQPTRSDASLRTSGGLASRVWPRLWPPPMARPTSGRGERIRPPGPPSWALDHSWWRGTSSSRPTTSASRAGSPPLIRERDGGLPAVQALGIPLASAGCVQVSMNLLDHERTPDVARVRARPRAGHRAPASGIRDSELIGLAPLRGVPGHGRSHRRRARRSRDRGPRDGGGPLAGDPGRRAATWPWSSTRGSRTRAG